MYPSYFVFSLDYFSLFFFLFSYMSHLFFHTYSKDMDASRSLEELSREHLIAKIGVDTAENDQERVPERPNKTQTERLRTLLRLSSPRTGSSR